MFDLEAWWARPQMPSAKAARTSEIIGTSEVARTFTPSQSWPTPPFLTFALRIVLMSHWLVSQHSSHHGGAG
jgi:hypothetical protein